MYTYIHRRENEGEYKEEEEVIKIARRATMFREDNIFPLRAKITRKGGWK